MCTFTKPCNAFPNHWHEHIEFIYVTDGEGVIICNLVEYPVKEGDLIFVNSSELHCGYSKSADFSYYCIIVDPSILHSSFSGACEEKYIKPITRSHILLKNDIGSDRDIVNCINKMICEYENKGTGFELSIKSYVFAVLVIMLRNHVGTRIPTKEYEKRRNDLERLNPVLNHIEKNYFEKISADDLARMINISCFHFSRLFKKSTGKTVTEYVNHTRINKAAFLLLNTGMSITEVALATGFNDINYFSRLFKKQTDQSPSGFRQQKAPSQTTASISR